MYDRRRFQQAENQEATRLSLYNLERTGARSGAHTFLTMVNIPLPTLNLWEPILEMMSETHDGVMHISLGRDSIILGSVGTPDESRFELHENLEQSIQHYLLYT